MKKLNKIIITIIIVLLLAVIGGGTFLYVNDRKNSDKKIAELENKIVEMNNTNTAESQENQNQTNQIQSNTINIKEESTEKENIVKETQSKNQVAKDAIKKALKDKEWIKNNVMMKESCFKESISTDGQKVSFMMLKATANSPIVAVEAVDENNLSSQAFIVMYKDGKVIANSITDYSLHNGDNVILVDPNNYMVCINYVHMGNDFENFYNVTDGNIKYDSGVGYSMKDNSNPDSGYIYYKYTQKDSKMEITKNEYDKLIATYKKYNFYNISTELTESNVNEYIK